MDQKQIIHIASEAVVISGLAIYFKMKTNSLTAQVDELKRRLITQEQIIEEFKNRMDDQSLMISKQDQLLRSLMIKQSQVQAQIQLKKRESRPKQKVGIVWDSETDSTFPEEEKDSRQRLRQIEKRVEKPIEKPVVKQVAPPSENEEEEENLDEELANELFELQAVEEQKDSDAESEIIEIDTSLKKKA